MKSEISLRYATDEATFNLLIRANFDHDDREYYVEDIEVKVESLRLKDADGDVIPGECVPDDEMKKYLEGEFEARWEDWGSPFHERVVEAFAEEYDTAY